MELISEIKHLTRINTNTKQTNAEVCVEVVTLMCYVLMTELPVFKPSCFLLLPALLAVILFVYLFFLCPTPSLAFFIEFSHPVNQLASAGLTCHLLVFTTAIFHFNFCTAKAF